MAGGFRLPSEDAGEIADPNKEINTKIEEMSQEKLEEFKRLIKAVDESGTDLGVYAKAIVGVVTGYFGVPTLPGK